MKKVTVILFSVLLFITMIFAGCTQKEENMNGDTTVEQTLSVSEESTKENSTSQTNQQSDAEKSEADSKETSQNSTTAKATEKAADKTTTKKQTTTKKSTNKTSTTKKAATTKKATTTKASHCTNNNNHSMPCGDMGKWFSSKSEVKSYVESIGAQWWNKYESGEITRDEYVENCPQGYECWSCGYCGKWTGNFKFA